jgi:hypothetical protein
MYAQDLLRNIEQRTGIKVTLSGKQIETLLLAGLRQNCKSYVPNVEAEKILRAKSANALDGHLTKFTFTDEKSANDYLIEMRAYFGLVEEDRVVVDIKTMKSKATLRYWSHGIAYGPNQLKEEIFVMKVIYLLILV